MGDFCVKFVLHTLFYLSYILQVKNLGLQLVKFPANLAPILTPNPAKTLEGCRTFFGFLCVL